MGSPVNWRKIIGNSLSVSELDLFARGVLSGRRISEYASYTEGAGELRRLLRTRGVKAARELARKAVYRHKAW